jgi:hypothetical protein
MSEYEGPDSIGWSNFPGRGTTYSFKIASRDIQVYVTEKKKLIRVHVDGVEWKAAND